MKLNAIKIALAAIVVVGMISTISCKKVESLNENSLIELKGKINTVLDPCHGSIIFDVESHDNIGQYGTYECCGNIFVSLNNSIEIPYFNNWETGTMLPISGIELLNDFTSDNEITMRCRIATDSTDEALFMNPNFVCTGNHIPIHLPRYVIESIVEVK